MAITDKTRKILWGRSGNRCSICRRELVVEATQEDDASVVGEECHIISRKGQGPRHDPTLDEGEFDAPENLLLLCRVHHKMVDDQFETYTTRLLAELKRNHELWVSSTLGDKRKPAPVQVRRVNEDVPLRLARLTTGKQILDVVHGMCGLSFEHDEARSDAELESIAAFSQEVSDLGDISSELGPGDMVRAGHGLTKYLRDLDQSGLWVFGLREVRQIEGGLDAPAAFPVAIIRVVRARSVELASELSSILDGSSPPVSSAGPEEQE